MSLVLIAAAAMPAGADAAYPGQNGDIAFARFIGEGGGDLFTVNPANGGESPLTNGRRCAHPTYRGDGERIAFSCATAPATTSSEIFTMAANGADEVRLTNNAVSDFDPAYAPDGQTVAFTRFESADGAIVTIDSDGQNERTVIDSAMIEAAPAYSPDGSKIVFIRFDGTDSDIWTVNADGSNPTPLTANDLPEGAPNYSPDGSRIVFNRQIGVQNDVFVMDANGANQAPLIATSRSETAPAYSPDGRYLVYSAYDAGLNTLRLYTADADGQNAAELTESSSPFADFQADWQPLNAPDCAVEGQPKQEHQDIGVTIRCSEDVSVTATASVTAKKPERRAAASNRKTVGYAPVTLEVPAGTATSVRLAPATKKGKKLIRRTLKAGKKAKGAVEVTATDDLGATDADSFAIKLKKGKKKK